MYLFSILLPAILNQNQAVTTNSSSVIETNAIPLEKLNEVNKKQIFLFLICFEYFSRQVMLR